MNVQGCQGQFWIEYEITANCTSQAIELAKQEHVNSQYLTIESRVKGEDHGLQGDDER